MNTPVQPRFVPTPYQDSAAAGRLILRDGSTAYLHTAGPKDVDALCAFFQRLSPESNRRRFFSAAPPQRELIPSLCTDPDPRPPLTLLVSRTVEGNSRVTAPPSSFAKDATTAEAAFAVDDAFHGKSLGSLLLERLALLAVRNGFTRFWAVT